MTDRIFQHMDDTLYIMINEPHLDGIFKLQLISPLDCVVDRNWFEDALQKGDLNELIKHPAFATIPIEAYSEVAGELLQSSCDMMDIYNYNSSEEVINLMSNKNFMNNDDLQDEKLSEDFDDGYLSDDYDPDYDVPPGYMEDCPEGVDPDNWREYYTGG